VCRRPFSQCLIGSFQAISVTVTSATMEFGAVRKAFRSPGRRRSWTLAENDRSDGCRRKDSGSASALVGGLGTDRSQRREERTNETMLKCPNGRGLSPRVRRHLLQARALLNCPRSISTCAEVPSGGSRPPRHLAVYLHVCGGTLHPSETGDTEGGLSPRVRRYPTSRYIEPSWVWSISTCAEVPPKCRTV